MMEKFNILMQNKEFMMGTYNLNPIVLIMVLVALVDLLMKGFAMWRAARLGKRWWFITLLLVNSAAILPVIFLWMTNEEYVKIQQGKNNA